MVDVVLNTDDLTVLGGPASIDLDVDFGTQGIRGSRIYAVIADPRTLPSSQLPADLIPFDLGIVITPSEPDYLKVYQKQGTSVNDWIALYDIVPNVFSTKSVVTFDSGVASAQIPVSTVFSGLTSYDVANFAVQYEIEGTTTPPLPITSASSLSVVAVNGVQILNITVTAYEFDGTNWSLLSGDRSVSLFVTVV